MGHKTGLLVSISIFLSVGIMASIGISSANAETTQHDNPINAVVGFIQELKFGGLGDSTTSSTSDKLSANMVTQLQNEVNVLTERLNSIENPSKIYSTELEPITNIDCSSRNMAEAFLSGWCPHQDRNIYFIEDSRVTQDSIIAIDLVSTYDGFDTQSICGIVNQDSFNFSFHEPKTGEIMNLENLKGFVMKCDAIPSTDAILKYTIINS